MKSKSIRLSSTEIAGLWSSYINDSMSRCILKYFLQHIEDKEIKAVVEKSLNIANHHIKEITKIFNNENFPIPEGFSDKDVNLSAPQLYYDPYKLSFVYGMSRIALFTYSIITSNVIRSDVLDFFSNCISETNKLYSQSAKLMENKGIYDRPPKIVYPNEVDYVDSKSFLAGWLGDRRPLNAIELTEVFFNVERNYFALLLLTGLLQVVKDKEIKTYLKKGKDIAEKQIVIFNKLLVEDNLLGTVPVSMEVTDSTISPFSDKLILFLINTLNASGISYLAHALSLALRNDLGTHYSRLLTEIVQYGKDGLDIMIKRGWLEQPPQSLDRKKLIES